ncbi:MAG: hypothetical protein KJ593_03345 [Candidatus Omnitrophica bacterium]|nr:hypothetical protein [Candidatus Omnitrophota bacterium]
MFIRRFIKSTPSFYIMVMILLGVICFIVAKYVHGDLKSNLIAEVIGAAITVIIIGGLLRIWYPPPTKTMSKFLIPMLQYYLFGYVRSLGFLLQYRFDNTGFKGMSPIDLSTYGVFLERNLNGLKQHLEQRNNTNYTRAELQQMKRMFQAFHNAINEFVIRYGNHLDDDLLNLLYQIRHICEYQVFYTGAFSLENESPDEVVCMGQDISNEPMKNVLILIEKIMTKIKDGTVLKTEPLPI